MVGKNRTDDETTTALSELPEEHEGGRMMIKKPVYFAIGIFCGMCFIINIVNGRGAFILLINAYATASNITMGICGSEDKG